MVGCERRPSTISHITLDTKQTGAPSAGNPHAKYDVAAAGNELTVWLLRHSQRKLEAMARPGLGNTAPVLNPTGLVRTHLDLRPEPYDTDPHAHSCQKPLLRPIANPATPHAATVVQNTSNNPVRWTSYPAN